MKEMIFILAPHFSQVSGSTSNTRRISSAHLRLRTLVGGGGSL
jgi:hypothetical protein